MENQTSISGNATPTLGDVIKALGDANTTKGWSDTVEAVASHASTRDTVAAYLQGDGDRLVLYHSLMAVKGRNQRIKARYRGQQQAAELQKFWSEEYKVPAKKGPQQPLTPRKEKLRGELATAKSEAKKAKRDLRFKDKLVESMHAKLDTFTNTVEHAIQHGTNSATDVHASLEKEYQLVSDELRQATERLCAATAKLATYTPRNVNKRTKRKDEKLKCQEEELNNLKKKASEQHELLQATAERLKSTMKEKTALQKKVSYLKTKIRDTETVAEAIQSNEVQIKELKKTIDDLEKQNEFLQAMDTITDDPTIRTFCHGKFTNEIREVVLELLNMNVSAQNVSKVIHCVLHKLTSFQPEKLPSYATCLMIGIEGRLIALMQAAKAVSATEGGGSVLANDGTGRQKRQYNVTQVGTNEGMLTLGLREMVGEDAAVVLGCSKSVLEEGASMLAKLQNTNKEEQLLKLVTSVDNTMSDRGAVMVAFNRDYEAWRTSVLSASAGFHDIPLVEQESLLKVEKFYCFMHVHINQATYAEESLKHLDQAALEINKESLPGNYRATSTSSTSSAIHAAAKSFQRHGDEQAGQTADFGAHLATQGQKIMFKRNIGNRAQILFENGAAYIYHMAEMKTFLMMRKGHAALNNLLQAVVCHLDNKVATAGAHALGILYYSVSKPIWLVQEKAEHIFELNPRAEEMEEKFQAWGKDASPLLHGRARLFEDIPETAITDEMSQAVYLMPDAETEELVTTALELICQNWQILVQRMLHDRLVVGGKYSMPSEKLREKTRNVPTTNKGCERAFAIQDSIMHHKPNSKLLHQESLVMMKQNRTAEYLRATTQADRDQMWELAIKEAPKWIDESKAEQRRLADKRQEKVQQMGLQADLKDLKLRTEKSELLSTVTSWGGEWKVVDDVDEELANITGSTNKKAAVVAQLKLQKKILCSKVPKEQQYLFQQTHRREGKTHTFSLDELVANLKDVIKLNPHSTEIYEDDENILITPYMVIPSDKRRELFSQQKQALQQKLEVEMAKASGSASAPKPKKQVVTLPSDPNVLVGKRIEHKFDIVEKDGHQRKLKKNVWYTRTVNRTVKHSDNIFETTYEVCYDMIDDDSSDCESDEETQNTFHYQLLLDYVEGDLKLIE